MNTREEYIIGACRNIIRVAHLLRKDLDRILSITGISSPQFGILSQLDKYGSMPLSELSKRLWVTCGNVTGLVDKLVASGYVRRIRPNTDRRVIIAELTENGQNLIRELRPLHREHLMRFTSGLDKTELRELQVLLKKISNSTAEEPCEQAESGGM